LDCNKQNRALTAIISNWSNMLADEKRRTMKTTRLKCLMPGADLDTAAKVGRRCRAAQIPARTSEVMFLPVLPPASLCSLAVRPRQSRSFALPVLVALSLVVVSALHAQSYSINWFKVAGGSGTSTGGAYQVSGIPHCGTSTTPAGNLFSRLNSP
jgi:hypothetical protein